MDSGAGPLDAPAHRPEFGGQMALDCEVLGGGRIAVGDRVELLDTEDG